MRLTVSLLSVPALGLLFSGIGDGGLPVRGAVLDQGGYPIAAAVVRVQATRNETITDAGGRFTLMVDRSLPVTITAWKAGYLNGGVALAPDASDVVVTLRPVPPGDDEDYPWASPNPPTLYQRASILFWRAMAAILRDEKLKSRFETNCSICHFAVIVDEWREDAHSQAARNPIFLTMYNGTDMQGEPGVFPGYRLDFPGSTGNCAACHAPAQAVLDPWGTDMNEIEGVAREGIFCDFCHKIRDVEINPRGGYPGVLSIRFNRPPPGQQVFYGPYDDVIAGPDTYGPIYRKSLYCAPCHSARFWGTPIYSSYDEWLKSPYPAEGKECQTCHMTPDGETRYLAPAEKGGIERDPKTIPTHRNPGSRDLAFLADAVTISLQAREFGDTVEVVVGLTNEKAGHHVPTDVPMRNMILLVEAIEARGEPLRFIDGPVVPRWGGVGSPEEGNYAGLPGTGFAKILQDVARNYPRFNTDVHSPTPHWRQATIASDNRIPARETDVSRYRFLRGDRSGDCVTVRSRLIYRRAFKAWIDAKGWHLEDLEIARQVSRSCGGPSSNPDNR